MLLKHNSKLFELRSQNVKTEYFFLFAFLIVILQDNKAAYI